MEGDAVRLPRYARGLKLVRLGVIVMLLQLGLSLITIVKTLNASSLDDAINAIKWMQYLLWANILGAVAMLAGSVLAVLDFRRVGMPLARVLLAVVTFAITAAALWWTEHVISVFTTVALDPESTVMDLAKAASDMSSIKLVTTIKDLCYVVGLIALLRTVRQSAVAGDHLTLRDAASSLTGLLVIMMVSDVFYQLTYGLSGGGVFPMLGIIASLGVTGYWIYCHVRLQRFLEFAAYCVDEPHRLPAATAVKVPVMVATVQPAMPSSPSLPRVAQAVPVAPPPPIVVTAELRELPVPRAPSSSETASESEATQPGPKFLR